MTTRAGEKRRRQNLVGVRLTDEEHALLLAVAGRMGVPPPSALRHVLAEYGKVAAQPEDTAVVPWGREELLRRAHAERTRLDRARLPVPLRVRALDGEYVALMRRRRIAAAREGQSRAA